MLGGSTSGIRPDARQLAEKARAIRRVWDDAFQVPRTECAWYSTMQTRVHGHAIGSYLAKYRLAVHPPSPGTVGDKSE